mmetsp:Transcript_6378/g.18769  ORF Transcript_6378/g.18769 Transcript_6378/m.18769 type:complete len:119 (-) Transcript_6378:64-420(-)
MDGAELPDGSVMNVQPAQSNASAHSKYAPSQLPPKSVDMNKTDDNPAVLNAGVMESNVSNRGRNASMITNGALDDDGGNVDDERNATTIETTADDANEAAEEEDADNEDLDDFFSSLE